MKKNVKLYGLISVLFIVGGILLPRFSYASINFTGATLYTATTTSTAGSSTFNLNFVVGGCTNLGVSTSHVYIGFKGETASSLTLSSIVNANSSCQTSGNYHINNTSTLRLYQLLASFASTTGFYYVGFCTNPTGNPNLCSDSGSGNFPVATTSAGGLTSYTGFYWNGTTATTLTASNTQDLSTHFISVYPADEQVIISPLIHFSANWLVSSDDLDSLDTFFSSPAGKIHADAQIFDITDSTWGKTVLDWFLPTGFETSTTTTDYTFNGTQDTHLTYGHDYKVIWTLFGSNYFNIFGNIFAIHKTIYFSVGTTTNSGHLKQAVASSTEAQLQANAFTNGFSLDACNPVSSYWNITDCILSMFTPDRDFFANTAVQLRSGILGKAPFGYVTRLVDIFQSTTTTALPAFTAPIRIGESTTTDTIYLTYDINDMVAGAGTILENVREPYSGKNFRDVFEPIVQLVVALGVLYTIIIDLMGSHKHQHDVALKS